MKIVLVLVLWYLLASLAAAALFAIDKRAARLDRPRVSERLLHTAELLGGWPGTLVGGRLLRHKTRKLSYRAVRWVIIALHVGIWAWLAWVLTR